MVGTQPRVVAAVCCVELDTADLLAIEQPGHQLAADQGHEHLHVHLQLVVDVAEVQLVAAVGDTEQGAERAADRELAVLAGADLAAETIVLAVAIAEHGRIPGAHDHFLAERVVGEARLPLRKERHGQDQGDALGHGLLLGVVDLQDRADVLRLHVEQGLVDVGALHHPLGDRTSEKRGEPDVLHPDLLERVHLLAQLSRGGLGEVVDGLGHDPSPCLALGLRVFLPDIWDYTIPRVEK